jgi:GNAT superfamily N-acetyltransferase
MSFRPATAADLPAILAFLERHEATSMFPLTNLTGRGIATESWITGSGDISGYLGLTSTGILMPQAPKADWSQIRPHLANRAISGISGPPDQADALQAALSLTEAPTRMAHTEPGFSLNLADLILPECSGLRLAPILPGDLHFAVPWRSDYLIEIMGFRPGAAPEEARRQMLDYQTAGRHRILWRGQIPLATAGINASTPEVVQVGGVYTPPALRRQGLARRAVSLMLDEARQNGTKRALLFAASAMAARAYTSIGFAETHTFKLVMYATPQRLPA